MIKNPWEGVMQQEKHRRVFGQRLSDAIVRGSNLENDQNILPGLGIFLATPTCITRVRNCRKQLKGNICDCPRGIGWAIRISVTEPLCCPTLRLGANAEIVCLPVIIIIIIIMVIARGLPSRRRFTKVTVQDHGWKLTNNFSWNLFSLEKNQTTAPLFIIYSLSSRAVGELILKRDWKLLDFFSCYVKSKFCGAISVNAIMNKKWKRQESSVDLRLRQFEVLTMRVVRFC